MRPAQQADKSCHGSRKHCVGLSQSGGNGPKPQLQGLSYLPAVPDEAAISSSLAPFALSLL